MDILFSHMGAVPRILPMGLKVGSIGYLPRKQTWVRNTFSSIDFSFILEGRGRFLHAGREYPIIAPCVFMQWPGAYVEYGPEGGWWEELFVIYDIGIMPRLKEWHIDPLQQPVWPIKTTHTVRRLADEAIECMKNPDAHGTADRIDRICDRLLLESRLRRVQPPASPNDTRLEHIRHFIARHLNREHDMDAYARQYGMSPASFRRHWIRRFGHPPGKDLVNLRMREACRLLAETGLEIKEIAGRVGFEDPLYFSRRFSRMFGETATAYRDRYHGGIGEP